MLTKTTHKLLIISVLIGLFFSCQKNPNSYTIKGKITNVEDSIFLSVRELGDSLAVDTIRIDSNGAFSFSGTTDTLTIVSLYFKGVPASPYLMVDKGWNVEVEGDIYYPDLISVKGGEVNDELTHFKTENKTLLMERAKLSNYLRRDTIDAKNYSVEFKNVNFELQNLAADYIKQNPTKYSSVILIDNFFKGEETIDRLSESLEQLRGKVEDFPLTIRLKDYKNKIKKSAVGSYAPMFNMKDIEGKNILMIDYRKKFVFLSFLSADVDFFKESVSMLSKEYDKIKRDNKDFEIILIMKDADNNKMEKIKKIAPKNWTIIPDHRGWSSDVFENFNIHEVPYNILISKEGKILERDVPIYGLNEKLKDYTKQSSQK